jgi:hypothetical protein
MKAAADDMARAAKRCDDVLKKELIEIFNAIHRAFSNMIFDKDKNEGELPLRKKFETEFFVKHPQIAERLKQRLLAVKNKPQYQGAGPRVLNELAVEEEVKVDEEMEMEKETKAEPGAEGEDGIKVEEEDAEE